MGHCYSFQDCSSICNTVPLLQLLLKKYCSEILPLEKGSAILAIQELRLGCALENHSCHFFHLVPKGKQTMPVVNIWFLASFCTNSAVLAISGWQVSKSLDCVSIHSFPPLPNFQKKLQPIDIAFINAFGFILPFSCPHANADNSR